MRAESLAQLLRTVTLQADQRSRSASLAELPHLLRVLAEGGQIEPGFVVDEIKLQLPAIEQLLPNSVFDDRQPHALRATVTQARALGRRGPRPDVARHVADPAADGRGVLAVDDARPTSPTCSKRSTRLLRNLSAFTGLALENMTRTHAWQFLHLGRRLERALQTSSLIRSMLQAGGATEYAVLEALLEVADSIMTYRSRYLARVQFGPVLDLLLDRRIESAVGGIPAGQLRGPRRAVAARRRRDWPNRRSRSWPRRCWR